MVSNNTNNNNNNKVVIEKLKQRVAATSATL